VSRLQLAAGDRIDLGIGQPDLRLLPLEELRRSADHRLAIPDPAILQYGPEPGSGPFREVLAAFLSRATQREVRADRLFVTAGTSAGLDLILSRFVREGDAVLVEDPSYFLGLEILRARRVRLVPVPVDEDGIDVSAVEALAKQHRPKLLYTIPIHHNPTSVTLSAARRTELVSIAEAHGFVIAADEVYQLLTYEGAPLPSMASFGSDRVLALGSFSKIAAPGLRLGWIESDHSARLAECGVHQSGGGANPFAAAVVESAIELGILDDLASRLGGVYARRARILTSALRELCPSLRFTDPRGGFFVWAETPAGVIVDRLHALAKEEKTGFLPGARASISGGSDRFLRLAFTYFDEAELRIGAERLARALQKAGTRVQ
jgi:DNA-binding transcriptional MocR family regulator